MPRPPIRRPPFLLLLLALWPVPLPGQDREARFALRTAAGTTLHGPQLQVAADGAVRVGKGEGKRIAGADVLSVYREGAPRPPLPTNDHLILFNGDRIPFKEVRLDGERLRFVHPDL